MSISLIGIMVGLPIGLAMRGIMGKEKFEQWLEASDYILYTNFSSENEVRRVVQTAGYDVREWGDSLKTHLTDKKSSYFLWTRRDGKIVAKMTIYDDKEVIARFVSKVERAAGRKVFWEEKQKAKTDVSQTVEKKEMRTVHEKEVKEKYVLEKKVEREKQPEYRENFPSIYVDADLVLNILNQYQIKVRSFQENLIEAEYECYKMSFVRNSSEEPFDIDIVSDSKSMKALYNCLDNMNEEYFASVQEKTYLQIREQIEEEGLEIEEEQVMEDNSIVITVAVS